MKHLGGWWRLWIFATGLWLFFSVVIGFSTWPNHRPTVTEEEQQKLTPQSQALLYHKGMPWEQRYTVPAPDDLPSKPGRDLSRELFGTDRKSAEPVFIDKAGPDDPFAAYAKAEALTKPTKEKKIPPAPDDKTGRDLGPLLGYKTPPPLKQEKTGSSLPDDLFDPLSLEMNDGTTLSFKHSATPEQLNSFRADYTRVQDRKLVWERVRFLGLVFMLWALPCLFVMCLGLSMRWVFRGFKKAEV